MKNTNDHDHIRCISELLPTRDTLELLRGSDVWCPSFDSYVDGLVRYVKDVQMARRRGDDDIADPLD